VSPLAYACEVPDETHRCTSSRGVGACELAGSNTKWLQLKSTQFICASVKANRDSWS